MHKIEIGKVGNFSAWNENFRAEISNFFFFFCGTEIITSNPIDRYMNDMVDERYG